MGHRHSREIHLLVLFLWIATGFMVFVPGQVRAAPLDALMNKVRPTACGRFFEDTTLCIGVELENALSSPVSLRANLTFPLNFTQRIENLTRTSTQPYFTHGISGATGNCTYIPANASARSIFSFPTNGSFLESEYYNLELQWKTIHGLEDEASENLEYTQSFNVTPFEWIDQETMQPKVEDGGLRTDPFDLRITNVLLTAALFYKGDSVSARVTVHNYGLYGMKPYLKAQVRETSGLYIGFDRGVWSHYGDGVDMQLYVNPGDTYTFDFEFGPVLYDDTRGIWALNGRLDTEDPNDFNAKSIVYNLYEVQLRGWWLYTFYTTHTFTCSRHFYVQQSFGTKRIFAAVVDDETFPSYLDAAEIYELVVTSDLRIGEGDNLGPWTTFEEAFSLDFRFYTVGRYNWHDSLHGVAGSGDALRNTAHALGEGLNLGGNWVSESTNHPSGVDYDYGYTQRENHGFDVGLGFMTAGFETNNGEGNAVQKGSLAVAMGTLAFDLDRVMECALHEICHLFGAIHGDEYGADSFGPQEDGDGYTYVMAGSTGNDLGDPPGWRMHTYTQQRITEHNHLQKFDGAPYPMFLSNLWYGQRFCYVLMNANQPSEPVLKLKLDGLYHWGYNSYYYDRFSVTDSFDLGVEPPGGQRAIITKHIDADCSYPDPGFAGFYVAYKLYWESDYWPSGFDPAQGMKLNVRYWSWQDSGTTNSVVDNVRMRVISHRSGVPAEYYFATFEANSPSGGWKNCHQQWAEQDALQNIDLSDSTVYLLLGFYDAWSADWEQELKVYPTLMRFRYEWNGW